MWLFLFSWSFFRERVAFCISFCFHPDKSQDYESTKRNILFDQKIEEHECCTGTICQNAQSFFRCTSYGSLPLELSEGWEDSQLYGSAIQNHIRIRVSLVCNLYCYYVSVKIIWFWFDFMKVKYSRSAPSDVIDQFTSLPVTVNRHHWCLTQENFTKYEDISLTSGIHKHTMIGIRHNTENSNILTESHHSSCVQLRHGCVLDSSVRELWSKRDSIHFDSGSKGLSLLCHPGRHPIILVKLPQQIDFEPKPLQYHPEKSSYTWTDQPGQQILHSKEVRYKKTHRDKGKHQAKSFTFNTDQ